MIVQRKPVFPGVIELNYQAGERIGCNVYLVYDGSDWLLIDVGFEDAVDEIVEMIRQMDFPLANCRYLVATHADVDHIQGLKKAKELLPSAQVVGHPDAAKALAEGDKVLTYAEITAQDISLELPIVAFDRTISEGDTLKLDGLELEVWHTPGHTPSQLSFRIANLLFSGDNIYRDGCVGNIDAHHGSDLPDFIQSLTRIRNSDVEWLLPSHGPAFRKDPAIIKKAIDRLTQYQYLADFGTCAVRWPLQEQWEKDILAGKIPEL